jgi:hypothetical protein
LVHENRHRSHLCANGCEIAYICCRGAPDPFGVRQSADTYSCVTPNRWRGDGVADEPLNLLLWTIQAAELSFWDQSRDEAEIRRDYRNADTVEVHHVRALVTVIKHAPMTQALLAYQA